MAREVKSIEEIHKMRGFPESESETLKVATVCGTMMGVVQNIDIWVRADVSAEAKVIAIKGLVDSFMKG